MSTFVAFSYFFTFSEFGLNGDVDSALVLHIIFSISFLMGYCIFSIFTMIGKYEYKYEYKSKIKLREVLKIGLWFSLLIISLLIIGMISAVNAAVVDMTFGEFFQKWSQGTAGAARIAYELSSSEGGSSGLWKVLSFLPLAIFNWSIILAYNSNYPENRSKILFIFLLSSMCIVLKILFTLDRISMAFLFFGILLFSLKNKSIFNIKFAFIFFVAIVAMLNFANMISSKRIDDAGLIDFMFLYGRLGLENLAMAMSQDVIPSYGSQSITTPLLFLLEKTGNFNFTSTQYEYVWNPAQYIFGHVYLDFLYAGFGVAFVLGLASRFVEARAFRDSYVYSSLYLPMIVNTISGIGVTWSRGIEFYFVIATTLLLLKIGNLISPKKYEFTHRSHSNV
jgi:hypothetical protein